MALKGCASFLFDWLQIVLDDGGPEGAADFGISGTEDLARDTWIDFM